MKRLYTLILLSLTAILAADANVTNGGFDTWSGSPSNPTAWTLTTNTVSSSNVTADATSPHSTPYSAKGSILTAGSTASLTTSPLFSTVPADVYLNFWYKANLLTGDTFSVSVIIYKSDGINAVGFANLYIKASTSNWTPYSLSIGWLGSNQALAAQGKITFAVQNASAGVHAGSTFNVDDVLMSSVFIGIPEIEESTRLSIFPNPVHDVLKIKTDAAKAMHLTLSDALGNIVLQRLSAEPVNGIIEDAINAQSLSSGLYFLMLSSDKKTILRRVMVQ